MGLGQSVWASKIPCQGSPSGPRVQGSPIWPLPIISQEQMRLQLGVDVRSAKGPDQDVIGEGVAALTSRAAPAGQAVVAQNVHHRPTDAFVSTDNWRPQPQADGQPQLPVP